MRKILVLFVLLFASFALAAQEGSLGTPSASSVFAKIWTAALNQYAQSDQEAYAITSNNGVIVGIGGDGYLKNGCRPNIGGIYAVAVNTLGKSLWQEEYATNCVSQAQSGTTIGTAADGTMFVGGYDDANSTCYYGCALLLKLSTSGGVLWSKDWQNAFGVAVSRGIQRKNGNFLFVGNIIPWSTVDYHQLAFAVEITSAGVLVWAHDFNEDANSFPGAVSGGTANFAFGSAAEASDGSLVITGTAEAMLSGNFAHVLVVLTLDTNGNFQPGKSFIYNSPSGLRLMPIRSSQLNLAANRFQGNRIANDQFGSGPPGFSSYPVFITSAGHYVVSGTEEEVALPFARYFFLMEVDPNTGATYWKYAYGGNTTSIFNVNNGADATTTATGGYAMVGTTNAFLSGPFSVYTGMMVITDSNGLPLQNKVYTGTTDYGVGFNAITRLGSNGFALAGYSYVGSSGYGGPGFFLVETDTNGAVGTCSCVQDVYPPLQSLDFVASPATFTQTNDGGTLAPVTLSVKSEAVKPITLQ